MSADAVIELAFRTPLAAPAARVFAALTEARHLERWFCDEAESEARPGGRLVMRWRRPGSSAHPYVAAWTAFAPPERCAFAGGHAGYPNGDAGAIEHRIEAGAAGDTGCVLVTRHRLPERPEYVLIAANHRAAWGRALARLAAYVAPVAGPELPA